MTRYHRLFTRILAMSRSINITALIENMLLDKTAVERKQLSSCYMLSVLQQFSVNVVTLITVTLIGEVTP